MLGCDGHRWPPNRTIFCTQDLRQNRGGIGAGLELEQIKEVFLGCNVEIIALHRVLSVREHAQIGGAFSERIKEHAMSTNDQTKSTDATTQVACEVCLKEVPLSEAIVPEASDYFAHFCGLDCYAKWKHQQQIAAKDDKTPEKK